MNHRMHHSAAMGYLPSPWPSMGSSLMLLKLNVTVYFTPELPFTPPALTNQPQKVVDVLKIMVVMTPDKTVRHLKQQVAKTIDIVSKDENLPFGSNLNLSSIRNSQNYVAHNDMILGHAFIHDENIYAIVLSDSGRPWLYMASPPSERHQAIQRDHRYQSGANHGMRPGLAISASQSQRIVERNERARNVHSNANVSTSEESNDSEDTYESSFVEKEDRQGYLDLEAEESDGSVSSVHSPSPAYKCSSAVGSKNSTRKLSLKELKKRRKNVIKVSESEDDDYPSEFKSHSHYVASLIDKAKSEKDKEMVSKESPTVNNQVKALDAQDDKEVDEKLVLKDIENNQSKHETEALSQAKSKEISSSEESSESSEEEMKEPVKQIQKSEITRDEESESESSSGSEESGSESDDDSGSDQDKNDSIKKPDTIEPQKTNQDSTASSSESDETENDQDVQSQTSRTVKEQTSKESKPNKRKYSSLSEIASNASNHGASSKAENKKQSSSSSPSSSSSSSDSNEKNGKRVRRSSLRSLSRDVTAKNTAKPKSVPVKPKPIKTVKKQPAKPQLTDKSKSGKPINALLNGSSEFREPTRSVSSGED